jgi:hypothetical protein
LKTENKIEKEKRREERKILPGLTWPEQPSSSPAE